MSSGTHHYVLTLQKPTHTGWVTATYSNTTTPPDGWTRDDMYRALRREIEEANPQVKDGTVLFFALERNEL